MLRKGLEAEKKYTDEMSHELYKIKSRHLLPG